MVRNQYYYIMPMCAPCAQHLQVGFDQLMQPALGIQQVKAEQAKATEQKPATVTPLKIVPPPTDVKPPEEPKP